MHASCVQVESGKVDMVADAKGFYNRMMHTIPEFLESSDIKSIPQRLQSSMHALESAKLARAAAQQQEIREQAAVNESSASASGGSHLGWSGSKSQGTGLGNGSSETSQSSKSTEACPSEGAAEAHAVASRAADPVGASRDHAKNAVEEVENDPKLDGRDDARVHFGPSSGLQRTHVSKSQAKGAVESTDSDEKSESQGQK